jgi:hypothetical protein
MKAGAFPPNSNLDEDCVGNWREHPQLRTRDASKYFRPSTRVHEQGILCSICWLQENIPSGFGASLKGATGMAHDGEIPGAHSSLGEVSGLFRRSIWYSPLDIMAFFG